ncbi:histidine kinase [Halobacteriovorax marinus]|uniref:Histidine kinase n=1 Tax=Halobacteriovorax marinus TaxID=97084 RepID=A0A1Y5FHM7_9BACT|nr:histidine kinase [Halobacteriovorax marinus]
MQYKSKISKDEINELEMLKFDGPIEVVTDVERALEVAKLLENESVLGFDTETKPSFKKGEYYDISLLQLSTKTHIYLFRLNKFKFPKELAELLSNKEIAKVGVAVRDDIKGLQKLQAFKDQSFFDLATKAKEIGVENFGLRALCAIFLGFRLSKKAKLSNWEQDTLTQAQIHYAACDAWVGHEIYVRMESKDMEVCPV